MIIQTTRHTTRLLAAAMALLAMLALSACSSDDSAAEADSQSVVVVFQLSIPRTEAATTRATTESVAAGTDLEHKLSSLHVVLYDKQGNFIAQEYGLRITPQTTSSGNYEYTANVEVSMEVPEAYRTTTPFEGELVVYANTGIPASTSYVGTGISDLTFQLPSYTAPDALPMWGMRAIKADDNVVLTAGTRNDLTGSDAIDLMRSVAKVTVDLTSEMVNDGWKFEDLWLTHYNDKGYVLPKGYFSQNAVNSYEFASATTLMAYPGDNKDNNARFRAYSTTENGVTTVNSGALTELHFNNGTAATAGLPVYIPEYDNTTPGVTPSTIRLKLKRNGTSEGTTYELKFANYNSKPSDDGSGDYDQVVSSTEFNLVRNTWYQYHVYKLSKHKIGVTLTVKPWYYVEHDPIVM
jgi:hypothetical protein